MISLPFGRMLQVKSKENEFAFGRKIKKNSKFKIAIFLRLLVCIETQLGFHFLKNVYSLLFSEKTPP